VRGLARAVVGLLQTGVDFARWLGQLTARRYDDGGASRDGPVDGARNDHHHAARGQLLAAESERRHELDATAGGLEHTAEIARYFRLVTGGR
jgi:hypothetical protein